MKYLAIILLFISSVSCTKEYAYPYLGNKPVILLTFTGKAVQSPYWNGGKPFVCADAGLRIAQIAHILDSVSWDFRDFEVILTVNEDMYYRADSAKRQRCIITETQDWFGNKNAGTSFTGSFTWGDDTPCFVFSSLLDHNEKFIAETISHELGHTLGLAHQARWNDTSLVATYNTGENGVAPIMGDSKNARGEWWVGYTSFHILQDDKKIIGYTLKAKGLNTGGVHRTQNECDLKLFQ